MATKAPKKAPKKAILPAVIAAVITAASTTQSGVDDLNQAAGTSWKDAAGKLHTAGVKASELLADDKSKRAEALRVETKTAIVAGFTPADNALVTGPIDGLDDAGKARRKVMQQRVGAYMGKLRAHLQTMERAALSPEELKALEEKETADDDDVGEAFTPAAWHKRINALREMVQAGEDFPAGFKVASALAGLDKLAAMVPAPK